MRELLNKLLAYPTLARTEGLGLFERFLWWEGRRILFNLLVGSAGILGCGALLAVAFFQEIVLKQEPTLPDPPIFAVLGVILYGILANLAYTLGFLSEAATYWVWDPKSATADARRHLPLGLAFSVVITLAIPTGIAALGLLVSIIKAAQG